MTVNEIAELEKATGLELPTRARNVIRFYSQQMDARQIKASHTAKSMEKWLLRQRSCGHKTARVIVGWLHAAGVL